jgi:transcriptional regulator with GAF, ATPase, and Fis domain
VATSDATVLVTGETGVGKELVAHAIHAASDRASAPFVALNCATLSAELLASELFGHVRGAFTGAVADRAGRFETVGDGTLLLDAVGELPLDLQAKLLRVIQERSFERVGEPTKERAVRGRLIAATNRDLTGEIDAGTFRADLYYRLAVVEIAIPPLRDRIDDLPDLVHALLLLTAAEAGGRPLAIPDDVMSRLREHSWPGNVRELRNLLQRMTVLAPGAIASRVLLEQCGFRPVRHLSGSSGLAPLSNMEADLVTRALSATGWHKTRAAALLGISRPTLNRKIRRYGIRPGGR